MPDFAPDFTPRVVVHYLSAGLPHSWTLRGERGEPSATTVTNATIFLNAWIGELVTILPDDLAVVSAEYIPMDSNVGIPITPPMTIPTGTSVVGGFSTQDKATALSFAGKTNGGTKASIRVFGVQLNPDTTTPNDANDFRFNGAVTAVIGDAVDQMNSTALRGADNQTISWYRQATHKTHDHWVKEARKTGGL